MENTNLETPTPNPEMRRRVRRSQHSKGGPRLLRRIRRRLRKVRWGTVFLVGAAVLAVLVVGSLVLAADSSNRVSSSMTSLQRVISSLSDKQRTDLTLTDFDRLETSVNDLVISLDTARRQLGVFRPLRGLDSRIETTFIQLDASMELGEAAEEILSGLRPTLFFLVAGENNEQMVARISSGERMVELLQIGRGAFLRAGQHLNEAQNYINQVNEAQLTPSAVLQLDNLQTYHNQLVQVNDLLLNAPELLTEALGITEQKSYLVLSQNSDELRPSGGYISSFGWLTVRNGRVTGYNYSPTTATNPNPPAEEFADQVTVPDWWIRFNRSVYAAWDGSWYADFPSTAEMSMWYYNTGNNPQSPVDGVIAIDIIGFEKILAALGSVVVPGYDEIVTPENFRQVVYAIRATDDGDNPHKQFLAALYQKIFDDWQTASSDPETSTQLLGELLAAIQQKHIMFYFADDTLNEAVEVMGWSGAQMPALQHDYLMAADANLGNKSNHSIFRQITYDVDIQRDGTLNSRATIAYDYSARVAATDPAINPEYHGPLNYNNLLQVFVPVGSQLESSSNLPQEPQMVDADNHRAFVSRMNIPYDSSLRVQYTYQTPPLVDTIGPYQRYRLLIQKQPGTPGDAANVQVTLPVGATAIGMTPEPAASYDLDQPIIEFRLMLETDQWIEVIYQLEE